MYVVIQYLTLKSKLPKTRKSAPRDGTNLRKVQI